MPLQAALTPAYLSGILGLKLKARAVLEGALAGSHRSPFHGYSSEFAQYKGYVPGDDTRHLDWKAYGRRDQLVIRQYRDETNTALHLALDSSASMGHGNKLEYACVLAASLALLAERQRDTVSLAYGAGALESWLPPEGGPRATREVIRRLESLRAEGRTDLEALFTQEAARIARQSFVFLFTDLWQDPEAIGAGLRRIRQKSRAATVVQLRTREEEEFVEDGSFRLRDLETGELMEINAAQARPAYLEARQDHARRLAAECARLDLRLVALRTDWPCDVALRKLLAAG
ncbi:MAG: hypothetical protein K0Q91_1910 [Fibrobacteria bacterium]|jgi:uncharacterized protein (DUF58 family)|nr:hypothetical protein [Fibrobacteria bacterium]